MRSVQTDCLSASKVCLDVKFTERNQEGGGGVGGWKQSKRSLTLKDKQVAFELDRNNNQKRQ